MEIAHAEMAGRLAKRHPEVRLVVEYLGKSVYRGDDHGAALDLLAARPNVFFKLLCAAEDSERPYPFADVADFYGQVVKRFGVSRCVLGSDYPGSRTVASYAETMAWLDNLRFLDEDGRREILGGTPARLWELP
jgi:predicted TIM-barrel fold metal-dependent hydrolase